MICCGSLLPTRITGPPSVNLGPSLETTDGGANWVAQQSETTELLAGVSFTDANHGMACGFLELSCGPQTEESDLDGREERNRLRSFENFLHGCP
jgi:hypothetical protein